MKKITFLICIVSILSIFQPLMSQTVFDLSSGTTTNNSPTSVTEIVDGITMTVAAITGGTPNTLFLADGTGFGTNGILAHNGSSTSNESINITFNSPVNVASIHVNATNTHSRTWTFTPTGGSNTAVMDTRNFAGGPHEISLNFNGVTAISITSSSTGSTADQIVFDRLTLTNSNTAPTISLDNSTISYKERDGALLLDASGTVNDADGDTDWNGGTLQAQITANNEATDEISIEDIDGDGTAITISGTNILANGTDIGDLNVSGSTVTNNTALIITFDSDATNSIVQEVLQSIRYRANTTTPSTLNRTVTVTATDNNAASSNDTKTISIVSVPDVTSIAVPSNATYTLGEDLNFTVNFDQNVIVNTTGGTPRVELTVGSVTRYASYISGTNSSALLFRYTVQTNDIDSDGITIESIEANGGTIQNSGSTDALLLVTNAGVTSNVLVDAVAPSVTSVSVPSNDTYIAGENLDFTINFNENITVNTTGGTPQLAITIGATTRQATYQSGTGTSSLIFRYTVVAGDIDSDGISIGTLATNSGTMRDSVGNDANLTLNSVSSTIGVLVSAPIELTITGLTGDNKVYDGTTAASATGTATLSGIIGADDVSLGGSPVFTFASANIGTGITINTTGYTISGTDSGKYTLTQPTLAANISAAELTIVGLTGDNKVYDGTTAASATGTATLSGIIGADDVSLGGSPVFTFAAANIGTGITINTTGYTISGTDSGNYTLTQPTLAANISAAELTIVGLTVDNKVYDGTTAASATGTATLSGIIGADDVSLGGSPVFTFASANIGTGITINTTGYTISGTDSGNYTLTQPTLAANISTAELTIVGLTGDNKVYDGTTAASATGTATLSGIIGADDVSLGGSPVFTFAAANVGTGITMNTVDYTISGTDSGNYTLTQPTLAADITAAELTIVGLTGDNKIFDGTTTATATGTATLSGIIGADDVSLGGSPVFTFVSSFEGTAITINTTGYNISGTDSGNYTLTQPILSGDITSATITWTGAMSNAWDNTGNWTPSTLPSSGSNVIIPNVGITNYPTISSSVTVNSITIASGASLIANASVTASVTYNRNLPTTNWYLVSAPVKNEKTQDIIANHSFATGTGANIGIGAFENNGSIPWFYANNSTTGDIISGTGVAMKLATAGDVSITGDLNVTNISVNVTPGSRNNFNLIGNPFTSYINSATLAGSNTVIDNATFWLWDGSQYETYNNATPIEIAPAQGFFIEANADTNITFSTANQSHQTTDTFRRNEPTSSFELFVENDTNRKGTKVFFIENKTTGFDYGYDSKIFGDVNYDFAVFTQLAANDQGQKLAIQTLPSNNYETIVIPVGLISEQGKKVTFSINSQSIPTGVDIYLEDRNNNTFTNLSQENYSLTLKNDSNGIGQFYIHMSPKSLSSEDIDQNIKNISIYKSSSKEITITGLQGEAKVNVYSLLGKEMLNTDIKSNGTSSIELNNFANGIYIIRLNSSLGNITKKIVLE